MKQQTYYILGLFIGLSSRIKKFILGLKSPRPRMLSLGDYDKNLNYDREILKMIMNLAANPDLFKDKNVLEIGPGPDLMLGLLSLESGASSYSAIDYFPVLSAPVSFYEKIKNDLKAPIALKAVDSVINSLSKSEAINSSDFSYKIRGIEDLKDEEVKYDIIFSKDVLEHVDDLDASFVAMRKSLASGGMMIHKIDFQTHTSFIQDKDRLNFLRYSENIYKKFVKFRGGPNRLRLPELISIAEKMDL
ncbi:MAG: methyltransferase domain-containing protein [Candidatus Falkowbacteria bacterium]